MEHISHLESPVIVLAAKIMKHMPDHCSVTRTVQSVCSCLPYPGREAGVPDHSETGSCGLSTHLQHKNFQPRDFKRSVNFPTSLAPLLV
ncbi:hypothetical protein EK904_004085 [Melospiza melodia maxima]|nr:hypothetical protein EK904_004085 [Melospiza melodia maxima]